MSLKQSKGRFPLRGLPPDAEPLEAEIIDAFDRWIHENHPNPQRIGCPGSWHWRSLSWQTANLTMITRLITLASVLLVSMI